MARDGVLRLRFADRVRAILGERGLTADDLAEQSTLPVSRIERILQGRHFPITLGEMGLIASVFGLTPYSFIAPVDVPIITLEALEIIEQG